MGKSKALVRVKVYKEFDYPKSMLHNLLFLEDARQKALVDMQTVLNEIMNNDHAQLDANMFKYEAVEEVGYKFRNRQLPEATTEKVSVSEAARTLAVQEVEGRHGPLNHEISPNLYEHDPEVRDSAGRVIREETWYMRANIESELHNAYDKYIRILRTVK